ncbi:MAG: YibE/F family protein [Clostridia bacterium]|nr:YibE/F family protein [Clostridia bacterium]
MKKFKNILIAFFIMITIACSIYASEEAAVPPEGTPPEGTEQSAVPEDNVVPQGEEQEYEPTYTNTVGRVLQIKENKEQETGIGKQKIQVVVIEIIKGDYIGEEFTIEYVYSYDGENQTKSRELSVGDKVQVQITEGQDGKKSVIIQDVVKTQMMIVLMVVLLVSIVALYGKHSVSKLIILAYTLLILYFIFIRNILDGSNITLFSILTSVLLILGINMIALGINRNSFSSIVGNLLTIVLVGIITTVSTNMSGLTGMVEEAMQFNVSLSLVKFDLYSLLFAMSLMVITGITINISFGVVRELEELKKRESDINWKDLFIAGVRIGKEDVKGKLPMIILMFTNFILAPMLLFMTSYNSIFEVLSKEMIAESIIIALIAGIGTVATVPIIAISYALINRDKVIYNKSSKNRFEGKRSLKL